MQVKEFVIMKKLAYYLSKKIINHLVFYHRDYNKIKSLF